MRHAIPGHGKSGGIRVFYFDYTANEHLFLLAVIKKGEQENLDKGERNRLRVLIQAVVKDYEIRRKKQTGTRATAP